MLNEKPYGKSVYYLVILLLGVVLVFWPLSFHVFSLKNDALNYFLPVRWQISEAINNRFFPYWSPYFNLGYCLHGDMQSGVWNPFVYFFSVFGPYTLYTLQAETLLYVFIAGTGMFFLLKQFRVHPAANLMCAFAYMLCGFVTDSTQYLNWISGAAFLPFVVLFFYRLLHGRKTTDALATAVFCYLLFVTAYPAHVVMTIYLLTIMFIWHAAGHFKLLSKKENLIPHIRSHLILLLAFIVLSLPAILSYSVYLPVSERGTGATYAEAMSNPLHPYFLISYLFPLPVFIAPFGQINDPLGRNCFFGIVTLFFCVASFFGKSNNAWLRFCKWGFVLSILFSLGEWFGLRVVAYYLLPMMDTFRHPSSARLFSIFFGSLLGAFTFSSAINGMVDRKHLLKSFRLLFCFAIVVTVLCAIQLLRMEKGGQAEVAGPVSFSQLFASGIAIKKFISQFGFFEVLLINILIQIPFVYLLYRKGLKTFEWKKLAVVGILNSILMATLLMPFPVVKKDSAAYIQKILDQSQVKSYRLPDLASSLEGNSAHGMDLFDEIGTLNMYNKKPGRVDYRISPANLRSQNEFWFNPSLRKTVMAYPLLYRADSALLERDSAMCRGLSPDKKYVLIARDSLKDSVNSLVQHGNPRIAVEKFNLNHFRFRIANQDPAYYVLLQNYFPFWKIHVGETMMKPDKADVSFMGFALPAGEHIVDFEYQPGFIPTAIWISAIALLFIVAFLIVKRNTHSPDDSA